eukprot:GHVT01036675.1.p1 GENE.GHVT01036675.1~~GHVT01036675.1.p1  ORF type:complete len:283 (+),score=50.33 GHVT01036675.1:105-953(+)
MMLLGVALTMWGGQMLDAIPEATLIGLRTSGGHLSWAFVISVCVANFPEALAGGYIMKKEGLSGGLIIFLWFLCTLLTGIISSATVAGEAAYSTWFTSFSFQVLSSMSQGLAGGAMLALLSASMLPAAFDQGGPQSGVFCVLGFLFSVSVRLFCGVLQGGSAEGKEAGIIQPASLMPKAATFLGTAAAVGAVAHATTSQPTSSHLQMLQLDRSKHPQPTPPFALADDHQGTNYFQNGADGKGTAFHEPKAAKKRMESHAHNQQILADSLGPKDRRFRRTAAP